MIKSIRNGRNNLIKYTAYENKSSIVIGKQHPQTDASALSFVEDIESEIYQGYIYVEIFKHREHEYILQAYVDVRCKNIRLNELHHSSKANEIGSFRTMYKYAIQSIEELREYINSEDWLLSKPLVGRDILKYKSVDYASRIFSYKGNEFLNICTDCVPHLKENNKPGNTMFRLEKKDGE